ncbi:hypothetical protein X777_02773, partial [Ooceraea biroi]
SARVLKRCRCSTAEEIGRLRALQNDLHYNRLRIRERRSMHYLCMRRNYNNCATTCAHVCVCARQRREWPLQNGRGCWAHSRFAEIVYRFVGSCRSLSSLIF